MAELDLTQMHDDLHAEITRSTDEDKKHDKQDTTLQKNIDTEVSRAKDAEVTLDSRIDNIITPQGDASLSEVVDARMRTGYETAEATLRDRLDKDYEELRRNDFVLMKETVTLTANQMNDIPFVAGGVGVMYLTINNGKPNVDLNIGVTGSSGRRMLSRNYDGTTLLVEDDGIKYINIYNSTSDVIKTEVEVLTQQGFDARRNLSEKVDGQVSWNDANTIKLSNYLYKIVADASFGNQKVVAVSRYDNGGELASAYVKDIDRVLISGYSWDSQFGYHLYIFTDERGNIVSKHEESGIYYNDEEVEVPAGAVYLKVNGWKETPANIKILCKDPRNEELRRNDFVLMKETVTLTANQMNDIPFVAGGVGVMYLTINNGKPNVDLNIGVTGSSGRTMLCKGYSGGPLLFEGHGIKSINILNENDVPVEVEIEVRTQLGFDAEKYWANKSDGELSWNDSRTTKIHGYLALSARDELFSDKDIVQYNVYDSGDIAAAYVLGVDKVRISGYSWDNQFGYFLYSFTNERGEIISKLEGLAIYYEDEEVDVPDGAVYLKVNGGPRKMPANIKILCKDSRYAQLHAPVYSGKKILYMGDSITQLGQQDRGWPGKMHKLVQGDIYANVAVIGAHWCDYSGTVLDGNPVFNGPDGNRNNTISNQIEKISRGKDETNPNFTKIDAYSDFDAIFIAAGTNDENTDDGLSTQFFNNGSPVSLDSLDRKTWSGAMRYAYEKLKAMYPNADIFICSPVQGYEGTRDYSTILVKRNRIMDVCNRISDVTFVDTFDCGICGVYEKKDENGRDLIDGLHPNASGAEKMARYNASAFINHYNLK